MEAEPIVSHVQPFKDRAAEAGLTRPLLLRVIESFYEKVRRDPVLGPVFEEAIGDHWPAHMERINLFWLTVTRLGQGYEARNFMPVHLRNPSIRADQLPIWLALFRETANDLCAPAAAGVLIDIAERMAESIKIGIDRRDSVKAG